MYVCIIDTNYVIVYVQYNGCVWKGGKLKLHKAKEHYLVRLRQEWAEEEAAASVAADVKQQTTKEAKLASQHQQQNTKQLRLFFPALRTVMHFAFIFKISSYMLSVCFFNLQLHM